MYRSPPARQPMLQRTAGWCYDHRRRVLLAWLVALVGVFVAAGALGGTFDENGRLPGTDSQHAYDVLAREFPSAAGDSATVVVSDERGLTDPSVRAEVDDFLAEVASVADVASVGSPYGGGGGQISADGDIGYAEFTFADVDTARIGAAVATITDLADDPRAGGVTVEFSGGWFSVWEMPASEAIGIGFAALILLIAFGSLVAMGLPLLTALVGVGIGVSGVSLWAAVVDTPDAAVQVASMVGIGVGIDYALFIVTRYREALARGLEPRDAVGEAMGTAGRAVVFAGLTVMISLLGLLLVGLRFFDGLALGTASAVAVAVLGAVTLLPAMLGFAGRRIDRLSIHRRRHGPTVHTNSFWHRWSTMLQRRPGRAAAVGFGVLIVLAAPAMFLRLGTADDESAPVGSTNKAAYELLATGFGGGFNGPFLAVVETPAGSDPAALNELTEAFAETPGVAYVSEPQPSPSGGAAIVTVVPTTAPQSEATDKLLAELRDDVVTRIPGLDVSFGGATASNADLAKVLGDRLPLFIGAVLALSFLLLLVVFRSVLVPLKAVVLNLLSIGAAYGVMVMVFQWGWFGGLVGIAGGAPIEPWAPMMLFAIVFGLSMDYEVFLLSRIREDYVATGDNGGAVAHGLAATARVITAAAAIMICVFGSFVVADQRTLKLMGLGLAVAVLVDATIVRLVLVPATMELLGTRNWWFPRWLERLVPHVDLDGGPAVTRPLPPPAPLPPPEPVGAGARAD